MAAVIKLKELDHHTTNPRVLELRKVRNRQKKVRDAKVSFEGETFDTLTPPQKDELLKVVAINLGLIEE